MKYYCWKWERKNKKLVIKDEKINLKGNDQNIKQELLKIVTRILGVVIIPSLKQTEQFEGMRRKIQEAMVKLNSTIMKLHLMYLYFNTYLIEKVFFRYEIVKLTKEQMKIL